MKKQREKEMSFQEWYDLEKEFEPRSLVEAAEITQAEVINRWNKQKRKEDEFKHWREQQRRNQ